MIVLVASLIPRLSLFFNYSAIAFLAVTNRLFRLGTAEANLLYKFWGSLVHFSRMRASTSLYLMSILGVRGRPFHTMPPKDPIVLFCNASKHSLLCQLFTPIVL